MNMSEIILSIMNIQYKKVKIMLKLYAILMSGIALLLSFSQSTFAADYHVAKTGSDSNNGSLSSPWLTPEYAAKQLSANDTLYIHAGTYNITGGAQTCIKPTASGITITNYNNDKVIIDGGAFPTGTIIAFNGYNNMTLDGLTVKGLVLMWWGDSIIVQNCDLSVGGDNFGGSYFGEVIYLHNATNAVIRNNKIHDNQNDSRSSADNSPLIQEYDTTGLVIEYNDFYNSVYHGIRLKDNAHDVIIRYNHFYNNAQADIAGGNQDQGDNIKIYNNIFRNNGGTDRFASVAFEFYVSNWQVYNNTFINSGSGIADFLNGGTENMKIWNNIFYNMDVYNIYARFAPTHIEYCDYNQYYGNARWNFDHADYATFSSWQSASGFDSHSITTDPDFVNAAGTTPEDFKRTSYPTNGVASPTNPTPTVMGAWLSNSLPARIGADLESSPLAPPELPPDSSPPKPPADFKIVH